MENVCAVYVLETSEDLVGKVAHVVVAEVLRLEELVKVRLHQRLHNVHCFEFLHGRWPQYVQYGYYLVCGWGEGEGREGDEC